MNGCSDPGPWHEGCDRDECTAPVGGEHAPGCRVIVDPVIWRAGDPPLVEGWCRRCDQPAVERIGDEVYCQRHAIIEHWKANSPSWNPERTIKPKEHSHR